MKEFTPKPELYPEPEEPAGLGDPPEPGPSDPPSPNGSGAHTFHYVAQRCGQGAYTRKLRSAAKRRRVRKAQKEARRVQRRRR